MKWPGLLLVMGLGHYAPPAGDHRIGPQNQRSRISFGDAAGLGLGQATDHVGGKLALFHGLPDLGGVYPVGNDSDLREKVKAPGRRRGENQAEPFVRHSEILVVDITCSER